MMMGAMHYCQVPGGKIPLGEGEAENYLATFRGIGEAVLTRGASTEELR